MGSFYKGSRSGTLNSQLSFGIDRSVPIPRTFTADVRSFGGPKGCHSCSISQHADCYISWQTGCPVTGSAFCTVVNIVRFNQSSYGHSMPSLAMSFWCPPFSFGPLCFHSHWAFFHFPPWGLLCKLIRSIKFWSVKSSNSISTDAKSSSSGYACWQCLCSPLIPRLGGPLPFYTFKVGPHGLGMPSQQHPVPRDFRAQTRDLVSHMDIIKKRVQAGRTTSGPAGCTDGHKRHQLKVPESV